MRKVKSAFLFTFSVESVCDFIFYRQGLKGGFCKRDGKRSLDFLKVALRVPWVGGRSSFDVVGQWWTMGSVKSQVLGYRGKCPSCSEESRTFL